MSGHLRISYLVIVCVISGLNAYPANNIPKSWPLGNTLKNQTKNGTNGENNFRKAFDFMQQFGYIPESSGNASFSFNEASLVPAIKNMQRFGHIPQTGIIDEATIKLMQTPRCGVKDISNSHGRRQKRYILGSGGWNKRYITYRVANWSPQLWNKSNVQTELRRAFSAWEDYSKLKFQETEDPNPDIEIYFAQYTHSDYFPFDGPGGILAHAYYPYEHGTFGGDIHFDESETWTMKPEDDYSGLDFFTVAVHEIGHSLGLAHSDQMGSIMYPYYKGYNVNFALGYDDILAMYDLYIKRRLKEDNFITTSTTTTSTTTTTTTPSTTTLPPIESTSESYFSGSDTSENNTTVFHEDDWSDQEKDHSTDTTTHKTGAGDRDHIDYNGDSSSVDDYLTKIGKNKTKEIPILPPHIPSADDPTYGNEEENVYNEEERIKIEEEQRRKEEERIKQEEEQKRNEEEQRRKLENRRREEERIRHEKERKRVEEEMLRKLEEAKRRRDEENRKEQEENYPKKKEPEIPDLCKGNFNAVALIRSEIFVFKGKYVWRYKQRQYLEPGYPAPIRALFHNLPYYINRVDAVYQRSNDSRIIFFIGKYFYVTDGEQLLEGSPRPLTDFGISEAVTEIDAAFFWPKNRKVYIFRKDLYWRFDESTQKMDPNYPQNISNWNGLPPNIDAVLTSNDGLTYFFKGMDYYLFDNYNVSPAYGYPQDIRHWLDC